MISIMGYFINLILSAVSILIATYIVPGVEVHGFMGAFIVAIVLGLVNATLGTILKILTFPLNWLTLGLVGFIINVLMILFVDSILTSFNTNGFFASAIFALVLSLIQGILTTDMAKK